MKHPKGSFEEFAARQHQAAAFTKYHNDRLHAQHLDEDLILLEVDLLDADFDDTKENVEAAYQQFLLDAGADADE